MRNYFRNGFLPIYFEGDSSDGSVDGNASAGSASGGGGTSFVSSDGTFTDAFYGSNGEENRDYLSRYKTAPDLAKATVEMRKKFGKDPNSMVEIPTETSGDDVMAAWNKANGVPETIDGYEYNYSDELAVKLGPISDEKMVAAKEFAHKELGLSPAKFQKLLDFYHTNLSNDVDSGIAQMEELNKQRFETGTNILKDQWLDGIDDRTTAALDHLQKYGEFEVKSKDGETFIPLVKLFEESPQLKQSPWLTMIMDNMAQKMGEAGRKGGGGSGALSMDGINSQIANIRAKQAAIRELKPVNFKGDPEFKRHEESLKALYQKKPA